MVSFDAKEFIIDACGPDLKMGSSDAKDFILGACGPGEARIGQL